MFKFIRADVDHYRQWCCKGRGSLFLVALKILFAHPASAGVMHFRFGAWAWRLRVPVVREAMKLLYLLALPGVRLYSGVQIHPTTPIGRGLAILHFGAVVLCRECSIGDHCLLHHHVSIVTTNNRQGPRIGDHFYAGVGAVLIGNLVVADNVICGAGAVVTRSVPADAIVGGSPARILRFRRADETPPRGVRGNLGIRPFLTPPTDGASDDPVPAAPPGDASE